MDAVVQAHNTMNELTWRAVAMWERALHGDACADARLLRFQARRAATPCSPPAAAAAAAAAAAHSAAAAGC